jgi:predicted lipoprotein with Yx(FWY)xxD motif
MCRTRAGISLALFVLLGILVLAGCGSGSGYGSSGGSSSAGGYGGTSSAGGYGGTSSTGGYGGSSSTGGYGGSSSTSPVQVKTATATINGQSTTILTDGQGMTLYYRTTDTASSSTCTGACASTWPPLLTSGAPTAVASLSGTLSSLTDANGTQVTYNGHLLYAYSGDSKAGDTNGEGIGGVWFAATPDLAPEAA